VREILHKRQCLTIFHSHQCKDGFLRYNMKLVTPSGTVSCLVKNRKDYFKLCIKFVNSTVVVRYFLKTKLLEANNINRKFSLP